MADLHLQVASVTGEGPATSLRGNGCAANSGAAAHAVVTLYHAKGRLHLNGIRLGVLNLT